MNKEINQFLRRAKQLCEEHRQDALRFASAMDKVYYENFELLTADEIDIIEAAFLALLKVDCYDELLKAALAKKEAANG